MTKSTSALSLSIVVLSVSSLLATGQVPGGQIPRQPRPVHPAMPGQPIAGEPQPTKPLSTNYRVTFTGKTADKSLGELSTLTCDPEISLSGPLNVSDTPTTFTVTGTLQEMDGALLFNYSVRFRFPITTGETVLPSPAGGQPQRSRNIEYHDGSSTGALKMKPGKAYELCKSGGTSYSIIVAPEIEK